MPSSSTSEKVRQVIRTSEDRVFTTRDILNSTPWASREPVDQVISRMIRGGELQRISRGLFSRPKVYPQLGPLLPDNRDIAAAVERSIGMPVIPNGRAKNKRRTVDRELAHDFNRKSNYSRSGT